MRLTSALIAAVTFVAGASHAGEAPPPATKRQAAPPPVPAEGSPFPSRSGKVSSGAPYAPGKGPNAGDTLVSRGKRLVDSHDCHACHTPMKMGPKGPEPDMALSLSGHPQKLVMPPPPKLDGAWGWVGSSSNTAFAGPWGITYAINLTPDPETGIGKWREEEFVGAIKTGKHLGVGRPIQPPMPWNAYQHMSDTQLRAIFAYLKTVPPVKNKVPDYAPPK